MGGFNTQPIQSQVAPSPPPPVSQAPQQAPQQPSVMPSWFTGNSGGMAPQQPQIAPQQPQIAPQQPQIAPQAGGMPDPQNTAFLPSSFGGGGMMASAGPAGGITVGAGASPNFNMVGMAGPKIGGVPEWHGNGGPTGGPKSGGCGHDQMSTTGGQVMPQTLFSM